jgi:hypothetical protein
VIPQGESADHARRDWRAGTPAQETGDPIEGATVELDDQPCDERGGGTYVCHTGPGNHSLFVDAAIAYAAQTVTVEVPEYSCATDDVTVEVVLLPAMA